MQNDHPAIIAPPPAIFVIAFLIGVLFRNFLPRIGSPLIGGAFALAGLILGSFAFAEMLRAKTHIDPYKPAKALVTGGPYRFSRNPIYIAVTFVYAGAAVAFRIVPALITLPCALVVLEFGVIRREERYLEEKFGERYREYKSRVRRWV